MALSGSLNNQSQHKLSYMHSVDNTPSHGIKYTYKIRDGKVEIQATEPKKSSTSFLARRPRVPRIPTFIEQVKAQEKKTQENKPGPISDDKLNKVLQNKTSCNSLVDDKPRPFADYSSRLLPLSDIPNPIPNPSRISKCYCNIWMPPEAQKSHLASFLLNQQLCVKDQSQSLRKVGETILPPIKSSARDPRRRLKREVTLISRSIPKSKLLQTQVTPFDKLQVTGSLTVPKDRDDAAAQSVSTVIENDTKICVRESKENSSPETIKYRLRRSTENCSPETAKHRLRGSKENINPETAKYRLPVNVTLKDMQRKTSLDLNKHKPSLHNLRDDSPVKNRVEKQKVRKTSTVLTPMTPEETKCYYSNKGYSTKPEMATEKDNYSKFCELLLSIEDITELYEGFEMIEDTHADVYENWARAPREK